MSYLYITYPVTSFQVSAIQQKGQSKKDTIQLRKYVVFIQQTSQNNFSISSINTVPFQQTAVFSIFSLPKVNIYVNKVHQSNLMWTFIALNLHC